jgi:tetratricopeptide (TPR) repeat protein
VDDIYEFENSEYRLASMQIKAIAYDVVTGISKKKTILKKKNDNEASSLAQKLATISDRIIEITDSLEEELQKLDQIEEKREIMTSETVVATEDNTNAQEKDFTDDKKEEQEEVEVPSQKIKIDLSEQIEPKQEVMEETEKKEEQQEPKTPIKNDVEKGKFVIPLSAFKNANSNNQESAKENTAKETEKKAEQQGPPIENDIEKGKFVIPLSAFKNASQEKATEVDNNKESTPEPAPQEPTIVEQNNQEVSLPDLNIKIADSTTNTPAEPENKEPQPREQVQETSQTPQVEPSKTESSKKESTVKKRFQKMTKNLSKAIMVKPSQLQNLRKSHEYQEQILANLGIFEKTEASEEAKNPITEGPKELPDDVERQIEDLTVKANIYYNEGEVDKAQELYDKIKELNEQYK